MSPRPLSAIVLAAGEGTRMRSTRPKPLHLLCGRAMLLHVLDALAGCAIDRAVVVVGHGAELVTKKLQTEDSNLVLDFVDQHVQRGTGDAVAVGLTGFPDDETTAADDTDDLLVLPGDTPLLRPETLADLVATHRSSGDAATLLTARPEDPSGLGRVVRGREGGVTGIVEEADATAEEVEIDEINTAIYCFRRPLLAPALRRLSPENAQGEYYLTDVVAVLADAGYGVGSVVAPDPRETEGVNDRRQLARVEAELRRRTNDAWLAAGVTMLDPERTYIDAAVRLATDVTLFPGTILNGETVVGAGAEIGPDTRLMDAMVGERAVVTTSTATDVEIGPDAVVGPYAALGPGASVPAGTTTGPLYRAPPEGT